MARKDKAPVEAPEDAPYGWSVIGQGGRRIDRWLSITAAQELVARIAANTSEHVTLEPTDEPNAVAGAQAQSAAALVAGNVRAVVDRINRAETNAELNAFDAAENAEDHPRETVLSAVEKRRAHLADPRAEDVADETDEGQPA